MNRSSNRMALTLALVSFAGVASAKDIFVSTDPNWKMPGLEGDTYTTLQDAVAKVAAGDTVWLQDGFVCESGRASTSTGTHGGSARVELPNRAFTLRSESGYVDEAHGKGAYVRGGKDPDSTYADGRGDNALRPLRSQSAQTVIRGLVLENGVTGDAAGYGTGGALYGPALVTNCVLRNCTAASGGGIGDSKCRVYDSVITNCVAFGGGYGGGAVYGGASLYNCLIADNVAAKQGGAIFYNNDGSDYNTVYSNCVFRGNVTQTSGGIHLGKENANTKRVRFYDCQIVDNLATNGSAAGVRGTATLTRCLIAGNRTINLTNRLLGTAGGVGIGTATSAQSLWPVLVDCVVSNNYADGYGAGLYYGFATNCLFAGNWACGDGGGAYKAFLSHCRLAGNCVSNIVSSSNSSPGNGGGCADSVASDCTFVGNSVWAQNIISTGNGGAAARSDLYNCVISNNWAHYRGAAVYNPDRASGPYVCFNCLIVDNRSAGTKGGYNRGMIIEGESGNVRATNPAEFYNCTIVDNSSPTFGVINDVKLFNCIVWGNSAPLGELFPNQVTAKYTCQKGLTAGVDGNVNADPKFAVGYVPRRTSPCVDAAETYGWMTAPGDVRASDLVGNPRILGAGPDMGCYEYASPKGLRIILE